MCVLKLLAMTIFIEIAMIYSMEVFPKASISLVTGRESLSKCVAAVACKFFVNHKISLVSLSIVSNPEIIKSPIAVDGLLLPELFQNSNLTVLLKKVTTALNYKLFDSIVGNYIVQIRHPSEIREQLIKLKSLNTWNSQAKFLFVSAEYFENPDEVADTIINDLKLFKIVNGVALLMDKNNNTNYLAYTWKPFSEGSCEKPGITKIKVIGECNFGVIKSTTDWYSNKEINNLRGCVMQVRAVVWPPYVFKSDISNSTEKHGIEAKLLQTMAEASNFSINISVSSKDLNWGYLHSDGTSTGTLRLLMEDKYDIAIGSFAATPERFQYLDYVTYNVPESLTWCVPHAIDTNNWMKLLMVIPDVLWILIIIMYLIVSFSIWQFSRSNLNEYTSYRYVWNAFNKSFAILTGSAVKVQPKTLKTRIMFFLWVYFTLHIAALYQSTLISVLTKPKYEQKITTIDDIFKNKLTIWLLENNERYFRDDTNSVNKKILKIAEECIDIEYCLKNTALKKNAATCTPRLYMNYVVNQYTAVGGRPLLYCFKNSIVTYPLEMYLTKDFRLKNYFVLLVSRITASGLIAHWEKQIFDLKKRVKQIKVDHEFQLSLSHLKSVFVILFIGNFVAVIVFIIELYIFKFCIIVERHN